MDLFRPAEGAMVDLGSLSALADVPHRLLDAWLRVTWPGVAGIVLEGLEPEGEPASAGPPGTLRLPDADEVVVKPGRALLSTRDGRRVLVEVDEPLRVRWPGTSGPASRGVLVLVATVQPGSPDLNLARERITGVLRLARPELASEPFVLPLAAPVGNGRDWAVDLRRIWQPDHPALLTVRKRLEHLEHSVWRAEPEGSVWDRQVLGRTWVRYQTAAAAAIHAARMVLVVRPSTTLDRVRTLGELESQLRSSVEAVAAELRGWFGTPEGAGPYRAIASGEPER